MNHDSDSEELDYSNWNISKNDTPLSILLEKEKQNTEGADEIQASKGEEEIDEEELNQLDYSNWNVTPQFKEAGATNWSNDSHTDPEEWIQEAEVDVQIEKDSPSSELHVRKSSAVFSRDVIAPKDNSSQKSQKSPTSNTSNELLQKIKRLRQETAPLQGQDPDKDFELDEIDVNAILEIKDLPFRRRGKSVQSQIRMGAQQSQNVDKYTRNADSAPHKNQQYKKKTKMSIADLGIESDTESSEDETLSYDEWKRKHETKQLNQPSKQYTSSRTKPKDLFTGLLDSFQELEGEKTNQFTPQLTPEEHEKFLKWMFPLCK